MPERKATRRRRYGRHTPTDESDRRDGKLRNANPWERTGPQQRFLAAYADRPAVASAARAAGVARSTVYRWLAAIPAFERAVRVAYAQSVVAARERWQAWAEERRRWRQERE